jgi:16S rRNA U1498 N3-methylase RsmE
MGSRCTLPIFVLLPYIYYFLMYILLSNCNMVRSIKTALISVFDKDGLEEIILKLHELGVVPFTPQEVHRTFIESLGVMLKRWKT